MCYTGGVESIKSAVIGSYSPPDPALEPAGTWLGRYRRPVWQPFAAAHVAGWTAPGDLVLDPFAQGASVTAAAAGAGRRAIAVTGNPVLALLLRAELAPPPPQSLLAALERLRAAPKADAPLGEHLDGLYATICSQCGRSTPALAFTWERGAGSPEQREYRCPACGHHAREPLPAEEQGMLRPPPAAGFHRQLVAERLRLEDGRHPLLIGRLLDLYTPRNLYALTALQLKIDVLFASSPLLDALRVALLAAMDTGSNLNAADEEWGALSSKRPLRSLLPPRRFREANIWQAFCAAVQQMASWPRTGASLTAVPLAEALHVGPGSVAIVLASARVLPQLAGQVMLSLSSLPHFEPAFAALSFLWSGWLLGKEGARMAERLLHQRTRKEGRYLQALQSALSLLSGALAPAGKAIFVFQAAATHEREGLYAAAGACGLTPISAWPRAPNGCPAERLPAGPSEHHLVLGRAASAL